MMRAFPEKLFAFKIVYSGNDGKLETAIIECDNGKQFTLMRWIYKEANKYQRLWVKASGLTSNLSGYESQKCYGSGHYDLGQKAAQFCKCLKSQ